MRETHVFFMYVAYPVLANAVMLEIDDGAELLDALRCKLLALHLTKGTSPHVNINSVLYYIRINQFIFMH